MYTIEDYARMLAEPVRGGVYLSAVADQVRPGSVVADIGAGPGVLGVYAAMLGARRVFLVEPEPVVDAATELARENGVLDRIEIIRASSMDITLPERADFIVSDLRGVLPLFQDHLRSAADMRLRHLAPGGMCAPMRDDLWCALVEDAELHSRTVGGWSGLPDGMRHESLTRLMANRWYRTRATSSQMLTMPRQWLSVDYAQPSPPVDGSWTSPATRRGTAHGVLVWFDTELTPGTLLSNSPQAPEALYGQAFFPFAEPLAVAAGDAVSGRMRAVRPGDEYEWTWSATVARDGRTVASRAHASLFGNQLTAASLARRLPAFVPQWSPQGDALRVLIEAIDGLRDLDSVAALMHDRFPALFQTPGDALNYVVRHEHLWVE